MVRRPPRTSTCGGAFHSATVSPVAVLASLVAQAAQGSPAGATHAEAWVAIALAVIAVVGNVTLALVRRGSSSKAITAEKKANDALALAAKHTVEIATLHDHREEHEARINDMDERFSREDPGIRRAEHRLDVLERQSAEEKAAREQRHREQAAQDLNLVATLTRMETNLSNLKERVEDLSNGRRRN